MSEVRIGLLGLGAAARNIHLPACAMAPGVRLVAGADPNAEARRRFAQASGGTALYETPEALLAAEAPDWVVIGSPPSHHLELCLLALAAKAHVLCEKPFVERAGDADAILAAEAETGRRVVVNHEFPRMPIFDACRQRIGADAFGELLFVQAWQHQVEAEVDQTGWRSSALTLREFGTHVLDLTVHFYGAFPESVFARTASPGGPAGSDLVDVVTLDFGAGRLASIVLDRVCRGSHRYLEMRLDGERASLRASIGGRASLSLGIQPRTRRPDLRLDLAAGGMAWLERGERRQVIARNPGNPFAAATAAVLADAMASIASGQEPRSSARRARETVRLVDAAYVSAQSGNPVPFGTLEEEDASP